MNENNEGQQRFWQNSFKLKVNEFRKFKSLFCNFPLRIMIIMIITNYYNHTTNHLKTKLTNQNHDQKHKYHHLTKTLHLTLKMTTSHVVETIVVILKTPSSRRSHKTNN